MIVNTAKKFSNARAAGPAGAEIGDITRRMRRPRIPNPGETNSEMCCYRGRGASPHDALLASAGIRGGEVEELRDQATHLAQELRQAQESGARLQHTLDVTKAVVAQRDQEQIALQRQLQDAGEIEKNNRQTAAAAERQIAELQKTIVSHEVDLRRSISINGLDEHTTRAVMTFKDRLSRGEDLKTAALGIAGYELPEIEAAMAQRDRDEMRALDALLMRPTWRRRVVLWLLGGRPA